MNIKTTLERNTFQLNRKQILDKRLFYSELELAKQENNINKTINIFRAAISICNFHEDNRNIKEIIDEFYRHLSDLINMGQLEFALEIDLFMAQEEEQEDLKEIINKITKKDVEEEVIHEEIHHTSQKGKAFFGELKLENIKTCYDKFD